jgi:hypothetical protein
MVLLGLPEAEQTTQTMFFYFRLVHLTDHNHEPMAAKIAAGQIVRGVKRRASEELTPIPRVYQEEVTAAQ